MNPDVAGARSSGPRAAFLAQAPAPAGQLAVGSGQNVERVFTPKTGRARAPGQILRQFFRPIGEAIEAVLTW